jgi:putative NIF3 family GTP cyclohydrolase 1 type 2
MNQNPIVERAWGELFQTERSAERHGQVEADRLGDAPPAVPLQLVSAHATNALAELDVLAKARGHEAAKGGQVVGQFFSEVRQKIADLALTREMSYRGTLLGIRHGIDLVALVHHAAAESDPELHAWTKTWLEERTRLVDAAARELAWFARNPDVAEQPVLKGALGDDEPTSSK